MHDFEYWKGGTRAQRLLADNEFEICVEQRQGNKISPFVMWLGVRVGGTSYLPTPFRWGYGWPYFRGYKALSAEELAAIEEKTTE